MVAGGGMQARPAAAAIDTGAVHLVPECFRFERILADHHLSQPAGRGVREGTLDGTLDGHGIGVYFTDASDARIRLHAHDQRVLSAVALELDLRLAEVDCFGVGVPPAIPRPYKL